MTTTSHPDDDETTASRSELDATADSCGPDERVSQHELAEGDEVQAVIKASEVLVNKD